MRKISLSRYIAAFAITVLIFLVGIFLGNFLAEKKVEALNTLQEKLWMNLLGTEFQSRLLGNNICSLESNDIYDLTQEKITMGKEISDIEASLGKTNPVVLQEKERYSLISLNQFLIMQSWVNDCNKSNMTIILYFYSNAENVTSSGNQGIVLDYIYSKNPKSVSIYAFDAGIKNPALDTLQRMYKVTVFPTLVINGVSYEGFQSADQINSIIEHRK